jgi:glycosyltransferase involved in cell wall biosynthesis
MISSAPIERFGKFKLQHPIDKLPKLGQSTTIRTIMYRRILFISPYYPIDLSSHEGDKFHVHGAFQRMRMLLEALAPLCKDLHILFFLPEEATCNEEATLNTESQLTKQWGIRANVTLVPRIIPQGGNKGSKLDTKLHDYFKYYIKPIFSPNPSVFGMYNGPLQKAAFEKCMELNPHLIFFHRLACTGLLFKTRIPPASRIYIDLDDVEHRKFYREILQPPTWPQWKGKLLLFLQVPSLWCSERRAIVRSIKSFVCSNTDRDHLKKVMAVKNVEVIPNSINYVPDQTLTNKHNILFLGAYSYNPNKIAAEYLISQIWPHILKNHPHARLFIAGPRPELISCYNKYDKSIHYLGLVSDLKALYANTRVFCCPIQSGSGTRIKILEAASYGIPVVSTSLGAEGLTFESEKEILLRDTAEDLASACCLLLDSIAKAVEIGTAARRRVRLEYDRNRVVNRMQKLVT